MTHDTWLQLRESLRRRIGKDNFSTWIEPLRLSDLKNGVARFAVPTSFFGDWVARNYGDHILNELVSAGQAVDRVEFALDAAPRPAPESPAPARPARANGRARTAPHDDMPGAPLDSRFTFDSFVVGKPNELAHAAARRVAEGGPVTFNPLFLYGGVGLGKTHLMHAMAREIQARQP
ncbi:MAG TPA: DnaA/Hda family protein, partial [Paracoccaceae bacterium]|nr:DnaA/Hda family protein [Paracoccaceae bacterium]